MDFIVGFWPSGLINIDSKVDLKIISNLRFY